MATYYIKNVGSVMKEILTGRTRCRVQTRWFGKPLVVLQVEVVREYQSSTIDAYDPRDGEEYTVFRDAEVEDLEAIYGR